MTAALGACSGEPPADQKSGGAPGSSTTGSRLRCFAQADGADPGMSSPERESLGLTLIASAENSSLQWEQQYSYIEYNVERNEDENRGYTGGIVGFTSKTNDMLRLVRQYVASKPEDNALAPYLPALAKVDGTSSRSGLDKGFVNAWKSAATDQVFQQAQLNLTNQLYFTPALEAARSDGLGSLGQFAFMDAIVMHGSGNDENSFTSIRKVARAATRPPSEGGDETDYLSAFLDARVVAMEREDGHSDTSRVDTAQRVFLQSGNLSLNLPLTWKVYGNSYRVLPGTDPECHSPS